MMRGTFKSVCVLLLLCCAAISTQAQEHKRVYKIAIVPQHNPLLVYRHWRPVIERLEKDMGVKFEIQTYKNFKDFILALQNGEPDFSYLSPYHLVLARQHQKYAPLLRDSDKQLVGIVVVPKDSPIKNIKELNGKVIAFPSPDAFAASLYLRAWLREKIGIDFTPRYVGTHGNVYRNVVRDFVSAGGGVNATLASQPESLKSLLRVLYEIPGVAAHPLAAHRRVPDKVQTAFVRSIKALRDSEQGRELLMGVQMSSPTQANYERDYAFLERFDLERYRGTK